MAKKSTRRQLSFDNTVEEHSTICCLCGRTNQYMSIPSQWTNEEARTLVTSFGISQAVCKPCRGDINKLLRDDQFTPRWKKQKGTTNVTCCIMECSENAHSSNAMLVYSKEVETVVGMVQLYKQFNPCHLSHRFNKYLLLIHQTW